VTKWIHCRKCQPIKNQQSPIDNHQSNLRSGGNQEHQHPDINDPKPAPPAPCPVATASRSKALLGQPVFLNVLQRLLTLFAGWQGHRPLGGGGDGMIVAGYRLGADVRFADGRRPALRSTSFETAAGTSSSSIFRSPASLFLRFCELGSDFFQSIGCLYFTILAELAVWR
jgi:hypothetical protein